MSLYKISLSVHLHFSVNMYLVSCFEVLIRAKIYQVHMGFFFFFFLYQHLIFKNLHL